MNKFQFTPMSPNDAACHALKLFKEEAKLCEQHPPKIAKINLIDSPSAANESKELLSKVPSNDNVVSQSSKEPGKASVKYNSGKYD